MSEKTFRVSNFIFIKHFLRNFFSLKQNARSSVIQNEELFEVPHELAAEVQIYFITEVCDV